MSYETGWTYDEPNRTWRPPRTDRGDVDVRVSANDILPVGMIAPYVGSTAPIGWLICDGATFSAATYPRLAVLLGGTTLPNLKGKVVVGLDAADADFDTLGEARGAKTHTLVTAEMPSHGHSFAAASTHGHSFLGDSPITNGQTGNHTHGNTGSTEPPNHLHNFQMEFTGVGSGHHHAAGINRPAEAPSGGGVGLTHTTSGVTSGIAHLHSTGNQVGDHTHTTVAHSHAFAVDGAHGHSFVSNGSGTAHNNIQPSVVYNYIVKAA